MYVDHFVWITSNLFKEMERFEELLGITPEYGGRHEGRGTHNALVNLGEGCYLELIARDPAQQDNMPWIIANHSVDDGLIHWAWRADDIEEQVQQCHRMGWELGKIATGRRQRVDNSILEWKFTDPDFPREDFEPFLIEWLSINHPSDTLPQECSLVSIEVRHSEIGQSTFLKLLPDAVKIVSDPAFSDAAIVIETVKGKYRLEHGTSRFSKISA